jgi:putative exporter of polyketide antibiotics
MIRDFKEKTKCVTELSYETCLLLIVIALVYHVAYHLAEKRKVYKSLFFSHVTKKYDMMKYMF